MKKLFALALATALCLTLAVSLAACGHRCSFTDAWSSDATYHWHTCTDESCTLVSDYAVHNWKAGDIITPATKSEQGSRHFTCAACGATKTDAYILSTTVPSNLWGEAFLLGDNYTVTQTKEFPLLGAVTTVGARSANRLMHASTTTRIGGEVIERSLQYFSVEAGSCFVFSPRWQGGEAVGFYKNPLTTETPKSLYEGEEQFFFPLALRDFTKYSYHASSYSYTASEITADGVTYSDVVLTFVEGKVETLAFTTVEGSSTVRYTTTVAYGTTEVTLPTNLLQ